MTTTAPPPNPIATSERSDAPTPNVPRKNSRLIICSSPLPDTGYRDDSLQAQAQRRTRIAGKEHKVMEIVLGLVSRGEDHALGEDTLHLQRREAGGALHVTGEVALVGEASAERDLSDGLAFAHQQ